MQAQKAPHLLQKGIVKPLHKMGMLQIATQEFGVLDADVPQALLHLHVSCGEGGHLRLDILIVWVDAPATLLCSISAVGHTQLACLQW